MIGLNDSNCVLNDAPTVAALHSLLEKVLALPSAFGTAAEREVWKSYLTALPPLPQAGGVLQPYENTATFPPKPSNSVRPCESRRVLRFWARKCGFCQGRLRTTTEETSRFLCIAGDTTAL
jgi:hypothetical protein